MVVSVRVGRHGHAMITLRRCSGDTTWLVRLDNVVKNHVYPILDGGAKHSLVSKYRTREESNRENLGSERKKVNLNLSPKQKSALGQGLEQENVSREWSFAPLPSYDEPEEPEDLKELRAAASGRHGLSQIDTSRRSSGGYNQN